MTGEVLSKYDSLSTGNYTNEDLINQLQNVESQIDDIMQTVTKLINSEKEESIKMQYANAERVIVEALRCYTNFASMTEPVDIAYWKKEFFRWGGMVRESTTFLLDGILGRGIIGSDILKTLADIVNSEYSV